MKRWPIFAFVLAVAASSLYLFLTVPGLPELVATKFHGGTKVSSVMTRNGYLWSMLAMTVGLPVLLLLAMGWFPVWFTRRARFPNSSYSLAPPQRDQTLKYLRDRGAWIGIGTAGFMAATHAFILQAHAHTPPRAELWPYGGIIVLFVALSIGIAITIHLHFRRLPRS